MGRPRSCDCTTEQLICASGLALTANGFFSSFGDPFQNQRHELWEDCILSDLFIISKKKYALIQDDPNIPIAASYIPLNINFRRGQELDWQSVGCTATMGVRAFDTNIYGGIFFGQEDGVGVFVHNSGLLPSGDFLCGIMDSCGLPVSLTQVYDDPILNFNDRDRLGLNLKGALLAAHPGVATPSVEAEGFFVFEEPVASSTWISTLCPNCGLDTVANRQSFGPWELNNIVLSLSIGNPASVFDIWCSSETVAVTAFVRNNEFGICEQDASDVNVFFNPSKTVFTKEVDIFGNSGDPYVFGVTSKGGTWFDDVCCSAGDVAPDCCNNDLAPSSVPLADRFYVIDSYVVTQEGAFDAGSVECPCLGIERYTPGPIFAGDPDLTVFTELVNNRLIRLQYNVNCKEWIGSGNVCNNDPADNPFGYPPGDPFIDSEVRQIRERCAFGIRVGDNINTKFQQAWWHIDIQDVSGSIPNASGKARVYGANFDQSNKVGNPTPLDHACRNSEPRQIISANVPTVSPKYYNPVSLIPPELLVNNETWSGFNIGELCNQSEEPLCTNIDGCPAITKAEIHGHISSAIPQNNIMCNGVIVPPRLVLSFGSLGLPCANTAAGVNGGSRPFESIPLDYNYRPAKMSVVNSSEANPSIHMWTGFFVITHTNVGGLSLWPTLFHVSYASGALVDPNIDCNNWVLGMRGTDLSNPLNLIDGFNANLNLDPGNLFNPQPLGQPHFTHPFLLQSAGTVCSCDPLLLEFGLNPMETIIFGNPPVNVQWEGHCTGDPNPSTQDLTFIVTEPFIQ